MNDRNSVKFIRFIKGYASYTGQIFLLNAPYLNMKQYIVTFIIMQAISIYGYGAIDSMVQSVDSIKQVSDTCNLQSITITAKRSFKNLSLASCIEVRQAEIEECLPVHLGDVLQKKPGFTQKSEYQVPITLRGLSGKQMLVLRNGNKRFSSYPAGFMSHTVNVYDLEQIEIEKGYASVFYGGGAISGIINLIDRSPFGEDGFSGRIATGYTTNNCEKNALMHSGWSSEKIAVKANIRYRSANDFSYADGKKAENSFYEDKDLFLTAGYKINTDHNIILTSDIHLGGPWGKPKGFSGTDYLNAVVNVEQNSNYSLCYTADHLGLIRELKISTFYSSEERELEKNYITAADGTLSFKETTFFSDYSYGGKLTNELSVGPRFLLRLGGECYSFHISTPVQSIDYIQNISFQNRVSKNARSLTSAVFSEAIYPITNSSKIKAGIRYDYARTSEGEVYNISQLHERTTIADALSSTLGAQIRTGENSFLKINTGRSFRMPETQELFTDNYTSNGILYGNSHLHPEYCYCFDGAFFIIYKYFELEASPFLWLMKDMISKEEIKGQPGTNYRYINIGKSRLWGGEVSVTIPLCDLFVPDDKLSLSAAFAYINGTDVTAGSFFEKGEPLPFVPPFNIKSELSYHSCKMKRIQFNCAINGTFYAYQKRLPPDGYATPAYVLFDGTFGVTFNKGRTKPTFRLAVNNIFNNYYYSYYSYLPGKGRDFRLLLSIDMKQKRVHL